MNATQKIVFVLIIGSLFLPMGLIGGENSKKADAEHPYQKMYNAKCKMCHGMDGKGEAKMAKAFKLEQAKLDLSTTPKKSDAELIKVTKEGLGKMPAYNKQMKEEEIKGVIDYIRHLFPKEKEVEK